MDKRACGRCRGSRPGPECCAALHVVHSVPAIGPSLHSGPADRAHEYLVQIAKDEYPKLAAAAGVSAELEVLGEPGLIPAIEAAVERRKADLLVIGRGRAQGFLGRLRSNAHNLIRCVPCPVLSV
jgi:nucleotide-binding universal stress UspA family protein